jgi:two-component system nitrogen regulation sensor histidine kinase GlnL
MASDTVFFQDREDFRLEKWIALRERRRAPDMAQIMSALPVPVVLLDTENRFRFVNHAAEQFLGISATGLSQLRLRDLVPEDNPLFHQ